jgi:hypothetical protein
MLLPKHSGWVKRWNWSTGAETHSNASKVHIWNNFLLNKFPNRLCRRTRLDSSRRCGAISVGQAASDLHPANTARPSVGFRKHVLWRRRLRKTSLVSRSYCHDRGRVSGRDNLSGQSGLMRVLCVPRLPSRLDQIFTLLLHLAVPCGFSSLKDRI